MADRFNRNDGVMVVDPDNPFYARTGVIVDRVQTAETNNRPMKYYRVDMDGTPPMRLCFREDKIQKV
jgi:hypothetical protein